MHWYWYDIILLCFKFSLSQTQHECLKLLTLSRLFQTLQLFVQWAEEGWYDFCSLPFAAKMQMSLPDEDLMRQIPEEYEGKHSCIICHLLYDNRTIGNPDDLLKELRTFVDLLINLEPSIIKTLVEKPQVLHVLYAYLVFLTYTCI